MRFKVRHVLGENYKNVEKLRRYSHSFVKILSRLRLCS